MNKEAVNRKLMEVNIVAIFSQIGCNQPNVQQMAAFVQIVQFKLIMALMTNKLHF